MSPETSSPHDQRSLEFFAVAPVWGPPAAPPVDKQAYSAGGWRPDEFTVDWELPILDLVHAVEERRWR